MLPTETREKLAQVEDRLRELRDEKHRAADVKKAAVHAAQKNDDDASLKAAEAAAAAVKAVESRIEHVQEEQTALLKRVGDSEAGLAGFSSPTANGWVEASEKLSLTDGRLRVDVSARSLLRAAQVPSFRTTPVEPLVPLPASNQWLFPVLPALPFGDALGDMTATDFTVDFDMTAITGLTGVERAPDEVSDKALLSPDIALATPVARQFAAVLDNVPSRLFDGQAPLRQLLETEMGRLLARSVDAACIAKVEGANPASGSSGADTVAKVRNAIAAHRALGAVPRYLVLTPADAAELDLSEQPGDGGYVFRVDTEGSGSPVWSLLVREAPSVSAPLLVDADLLGVMYYGDGSVLVDPFSGMRQNLVSVRAEAESVCHVRDSRGAYQIA